MKKNKKRIIENEKKKDQFEHGQNSNTCDRLGAVMSGVGVEPHG